MRCIDVWVPLHLSGLWVPVWADNPSETGSLGAGFCLEPGLRARACISEETRVLYNGVDVSDTCFIRFLSEKLGPLKLAARSPAPLGAGLGASAALSLAYSVAASLLYGKTMILEDAAAPAHIAEVTCRTGLGDVVAEYHGGFEIRVRPGPPGRGVVKHVYTPRPPYIYAVYLDGLLDTPRMLASIRSDAYRLAREMLARLMESPSVEFFVEQAHAFTSMIFDYSARRRLIHGVMDTGASLFFLKKNVLAIVSMERNPRLERFLGESRVNYTLYRLTWTGLRVSGITRGRHGPV